MADTALQAANGSDRRLRRLALLLMRFDIIFVLLNESLVAGENFLQKCQCAIDIRDTTCSPRARSYLDQIILHVVAIAGVFVADPQSLDIIIADCAGYCLLTDML